MKCDLPCISENRTAAIGCPVFDGMGVFICNIYNISAVVIPFLLATDHCPLFTARCTLLIVYPISKRFFRHVATLPRPSAILKKSILPPKKFPGAGPRAYRICNTVYKKSGGLRRGRSRRGRLGGTGLSLRGGSLQGLLLQGLLLWRDSSQTGHHFPVSNSMKCNSGMGCQTTSAATSMVSRKVIISPFVTLAPYIEYIVCWISSNPFSEIR